MSLPTLLGSVTTSRPKGRHAACADRASGPRGDIQGMRAVAVLLVMLGHAGLLGLRGGYVGVDVFFVISGFLITGILARGARSTGRVSIADFYARRARRILPAASVVLVLVAAMSVLVYTAGNATTALHDVGWAAFFAANIHFANAGTGYFTESDFVSPVQHFWSLAVEEQFYLLWPALIAAMFALEPATIERITQGLVRLAGRAMLAPAGGTWRDSATGLDEPMPTRTTRESDALVLPPMLIPTTAREGKTAYTVDEPFRTQTCRRETAIVLPPRGEFITVLRGGGSKQSGYRPVDQEPLATFSAQGGHQALIGPPDTFLMSYYRNGSLQPVSEPIGTLTTRDRFAVIGANELPAVEECTFRMLDTQEIAAGMAFHPHYQVKGNKRQQTMGYGNAVTPPAAEIIGSALIETITGHDLPR
jgi:hypothetical protein